MEEEFKTIIDYYGLSSQLKELSKSIYELQESILLDEGDNKSLNNILKKRANVEMLLRQIDEYFDIKYSDFTMFIVKETNKQIEKITNDIESKRNE